MIPPIPKIRENSSVISTLAQFNHSVSVDICRNLSFLYTNVEDVFGNREAAAPSAADSYFHSEELRKGFLEFSRRFDIGIEKVEIVITNGGMEPLFFHRGVHRPISRAAESHGTNMVYNLFPTIFYAMQRGGVAVVDELDNAIHSLLVPEIVDLFVDPDRNPLRAQLIAVLPQPEHFAVPGKGGDLFHGKVVGRGDIDLRPEGYQGGQAGEQHLRELSGRRIRRGAEDCVSGRTGGSSGRSSLRAKARASWGMCGGSTAWPMPRAFRFR